MPHDHFVILMQLRIRLYNFGVGSLHIIILSLGITHIFTKKEIFVGHQNVYHGIFPGGPILYACVVTYTQTLY